MRTRRPTGIARPPGIARSLSERARVRQGGSATGATPTETAEATAAGLGLRLGGLFAALRDVVDQLGTRVDQSSGIGGHDGRMVFGFSVRAGLAHNGPEPFGNIAPDGCAPDAAASRQPIIDVHADGSDIVIIAELPGVDEAGVEVSVDNGALLIDAPGWHKRLELPRAVVTGSLRRSCRNGILEVRLTPREEAAP